MSMSQRDGRVVQIVWTAPDGTQRVRYQGSPRSRETLAMTDHVNRMGQQARARGERSPYTIRVVTPGEVAS
jgi:hypothetical protein